MIDWTDDRAADRAAVVADPAGYQGRVAPFRIRRLERIAREAIAAGKPFAALTACDRGLAYAPDHPALLALVAEAELAAAASTASAGPPASVPVAVSPPLRWSRRTWLIVAGIAVACVGLVALAASQGAQAPSPTTASGSADPFAVLAPPLTITRTESHMDDRDRELVHDVVGVFGKFIDVAAKDGGAHLTVNGQPVNAKGWLQKAAGQPPSEAIDSVRHALALEPGWVDAQIALCIEMSAAEDDGAIDACDTALASKPGDVVSRAARAKARLHACKQGDAKACNSTP